MSVDDVFKYFVGLISFLSVLTLFLMVLELFRYSLPVLSLKFIFGINWNPVAGSEEYGILPYILGTIVTSTIAMIVGVPISLGIAIYLSEMAPNFIRKTLSFVIELLAAVPSVIYGLWGLFIFRFWVKDFIEEPLSKYLGFLPIFEGEPFGLDILTAGLILAIMIIPTVSSVSREVLMAVPNSQREAVYSLGATKWEVIKVGVLSYAKSGLVGASILGLGRAVGETMAVTMVIGNAVGPSALPTSLFKAGQTMASLIANEFNEADPTTLHPNALIGVGLILFVLALTINLLAQVMVWRILKIKEGAVE
ncbi:MAG: phosphate ABC transporter permease subunit PstC [Nitrososphaeria archaeon]